MTKQFLYIPAELSSRTNFPITLMTFMGSSRNQYSKSHTVIRFLYRIYNCISLNKQESKSLTPFVNDTLSLLQNDHDTHLSDTETL